MHASERKLVKRLLTLCPGFSDHGDDHHASDEPRDVLRCLAAFLAEACRAKSQRTYGALFDVVEQTLVDGHPQLRKLLIWGLLKEIQFALSDGRPIPDAILSWYGPVTRKAWAALQMGWSGLEPIESIVWRGTKGPGTVQPDKW